MYIKTKAGWKRLWELSAPTLSEVRERVVWFSAASPEQSKERAEFEREQHKLLLDLRAANE